MSFKKLGFSDDQTYTTLEKRMKCGIGICGRCNVGPEFVCVDGPVFSLAELGSWGTSCSRPAAEFRGRARCRSRGTAQNFTYQYDIDEWQKRSDILVDWASAAITLDVNNASRYYSAVIVSFKDADTERLARGNRVKRFVNVESVARRKLRQLEIAATVEDLRVPPGNQLELLKGDRNGQHSIRVNDQYRVGFRWTSAGAEDVEIVDYH